MGTEFQPHERRMIVEAIELSQKAEDLDAFIESNPLFFTLDASERIRMSNQLTSMKSYYDILKSRINTFGGSIERAVAEVE